VAGRLRVVKRASEHWFKAAEPGAHRVCPEEQEGGRRKAEGGWTAARPPSSFLLPHSPSFLLPRAQVTFVTSNGGGMTTDVLDREDFLDSHRALAVCAREFDRLADDIAKRVTDLEDESKGLKADVRRSPGRCIVQLGPVALTISWLRTRAETVSQGRLLIVEWNGTVGANGAQEYVNGVPTVAVTQTAKVVRETVFIADASDEKSW